MKYQIILGLCLFLAPALHGQQLDKYWVQFTDKENTPFSILKPQEFLSPRAIERRKKQGIIIDETDLPVNPAYLNQLKKLGAKVYTVSKWLNAATVHIEKEEALEKIKTLPFVKKVEATGRYRKPRPTRANKRRDYRETYPTTASYYGYGANQIQMLNGDGLHNIGYRGKGMLIAVLDGGFVNVDIMPFFDSLRAESRLYTSRDFVDNDLWAYEASSHGSQVISTIASNLPGLFVGTAPDAAYVCIRTEEVGSELRIEEDNWIAGAEYADSLGVDVINSSLGYTSFDQRSMSYTYQDMDGNTARITQGADLASKKGILVVNSAGNEGDGSWRYVGAPADADSVMAIGGVDRYRFKANFSSYGPTRDGRIKPSVAARGRQTVVGSLYSYDVDSANGTSFSSPIMAGMVTALWQAFPNKNNMEIKEAVEASGDRSKNPDNKLGYGIPDMVNAYLMLAGASSVRLNNPKERPVVVPSPFVDYFDLLMYSKEKGEIEIMVFNLLGQEVLKSRHKMKKNHLNRYRISQLKGLPAGSYIVSVKAGLKTFKVNILKS